MGIGNVLTLPVVPMDKDATIIDEAIPVPGSWSTHVSSLHLLPGTVLLTSSHNELFQPRIGISQVRRGRLVPNYALDISGAITKHLL